MLREIVTLKHPGASCGECARCCGSIRQETITQYRLKGGPHGTYRIFFRFLNGIFTHFIGSLSQDDFAYMLDVHINTVYWWECKDRDSNFPRHCAGTLSLIMPSRGPSDGNFSLTARTDFNTGSSLRPVKIMLRNISEKTFCLKPLNYKNVIYVNQFRL